MSEFEEKKINNFSEPTLSAKEAAKKLRCAPDYVGKLCREGKITGQRVSGVWFVTLSSLEKFKNEREEAKKIRSEKLSNLRKLENEKFAKNIAISDLSRTEVPQKSAPKFSALFLGISMFFGAFLMVAATTLPMSGRFAGWVADQSASVAQVNSPFFGAHPLPVSLPTTSQSLPTSIFSNILSFFFGRQSTPRYADTQSTPLVGAASSTIQKKQDTATAVARVTQTPVVQHNTYPIVERTFERVVSGVSEELLTSKLAELTQRLRQEINSAINGIGPSLYSSGGIANNIALSQIIDKLTGVSITNSTLTNVTVSGVSGITDADIPDNLTFNLGAIDGPLQANNGVISATSSIGVLYGGTGLNAYTTGDILYASGPDTLAVLPIGATGRVLKVSGGVPTWGLDNTGGGSGSSVWATTTDNLALYPADPSQVVIIGDVATTTTGNIFEVSGSSLFRNLLTAYGIVTAPRFVATSSSVASVLPYASSTAFSTSYASTTNLHAGSFTLGSLSGLLSASNGIVSAVATSSLGLLSSTSIQATGPLSFNSSTGVFSISQASTGADGYLSSTDWNFFNQKVSSSSLSSFASTFKDWKVVGNYLTPTSTLQSIIAAASSTIGDGTQAGGLTISGGATTTGNAYFAGNVGIGTASPESKFMVYDATADIRIGNVSGNFGGISFNGTLSTTNFNIGSGITDKSLYLNRPTGTGIYFKENNGTAQMTILPGGNVGVGTTDPSALFTVNGLASTTDLTISSIASGNLLKTTTAGSVIAAVAGTDYATPSQISLAFPFTPTTSFGTVANSTSTLLLLTNGLSASSTIRFGNAGVASQFQYDSTTGFLGLGTSTPWGQLSINPTGTNLNAPSFVIGSTTATSFMVTNAGNVGIGTVAPNAKLRITDNSANWVSYLHQSNSSGFGQYIFLNSNSSSLSALKIQGWTGSQGVEVLDVKSNGLVGIGTTTPFAKLSVHANNGEANGVLFAVASSTATATTTLLSVRNTSAFNTLEVAGGMYTTGSVGGLYVGTAGRGVFWNNSLTYILGNGATGGTSNYLAFGTNATERGRFDSNGNLGIGTTSPIAQFTLATPNNASGSLLDLFLIASSTQTATTTLFKIDNTGSSTLLGIASSTGLIVSGLNAAACDLKGDVNGAIYCGTDAGSSFAFPFTPTIFGSTNANATSTLIGFTQGIYALASSTIGNGTQTGGLTISGGATTTGNAYFGGNVGIGTTSSDFKLAVLDSSLNTYTGLKIANYNSGAFASPAVNLQNVDGANAYFSLFNSTHANFPSQAQLYSTAANGLSLRAQTGYLSFSTNNLSERMRITLDGNVGLGTTSPWAKLSINNSTNDTGGQPLFTIASSTDSATTTLFVVTNTGNVGIGTSSPGMIGTQLPSLTISSGANVDSISLTRTSPTLRTWVLGPGTGTGTGAFGIMDASVGGVGTFATRFLIDTSGNVGLGTTIPNARLTVAATSSNSLIPLLALRTATNAGLATTSVFLVDANGLVGIGSTSPYAKLAVHANNGETGNILFAIGSSTASATTTLFSVDNTGLTTLLKLSATAATTTNFAITSLSNAGLAVDSTGRVYAAATTTFSSGLTYANGNVTNSGVTSLTAGSGISVSASTGAVTVTNTVGFPFTPNTNFAVNVNSTSTPIWFTQGLMASSTSYIASTTFAINGNVGIGTAAPTSRLTVSAATSTLPTPPTGTVLHLSNAEGNVSALAIDSFGGLSSVSNINFRHAGGSIQNTSAVESGTALGNLVFTGYGTTGYLNNSGAKIGAFAGETWTDSTGAALLAFFTRASGNTATSLERMRIDSTGNIGIGGASTTPWGLLSVNPDGITGPSFVIGSSTKTDFVVTNAGNVGIGTTSAYSRLHITDINTTGNVALTIQDNESDATLSALTELYGASLTYNMSGGQRELDFLNRSFTSQAGMQGFRFVQQTGVGTFNTIMTINGDSGRLGIGTTTPFAKLAIHATSDETNTRLFEIASSTASATTTLFVVTNAGYVGVGTANPLASLSVTGSVSGAGGAPTTAGTHIGTNSGYASIEMYNTSGTYFDFSGTSGRDYDFRQIFTASTNNLVFNSSSTAAILSLTGDGKVGIGDSSPTAKLTVTPLGESVTNVATTFLVGTSTSVGTTAGSYTYPFEFQSNTGGNNNRLQIAPYRRVAGATWQGAGYRLQYAVDSSFTDGSKAFIEIGGGDAVTSGGGLISLGTAGFDRLTVSNAGNVGVGTTTPWAKLSINNSTNDTGGQPLFAIASSTDSATTTLFVVTNTGNVGIGTTSPLFPLTIDVASTSNRSPIRISNASTTQYTNISYQGTGRLWTAGVGNASETNYGVANKFFIFDQGALAMRFVVDTSGNVGIGTTSPWGLLSVNPNGITGPSFVIGSSTKTDFIVTNAGNVGIGTAAPAEKLSLYGAAGEYPSLGFHSNAGGINNTITQDSLLGLQIRSASYGLLMQFANSTGSVGLSTTTPWAKLSINNSTNDTAMQPLFAIASSTATATTTLFVVTNAGNVGIGTAAPTTMLDVRSSGTADPLAVFGNTAAAHSVSINLSNSSGSLKLFNSSASNNFFSGTVAGDTGLTYVNNKKLWFTESTGLFKVVIDGANDTFGIGSSTPNARLSVHANNGDTNLNLFAIGSSTQSATTTLFVVNNNGNVGIGTTTPLGALHVVSNSVFGGVFIDAYGGGVNNNTVASRFANGTAAAPTAATADSILTFQGGRGYGTSQFSTNSVVGFGGFAEATFTDSSNPTYLALFTTPTNSVTRAERLRVDSTGNVGVASTSPWGLLSVNPSGISGPAFVIGSSTKTSFIVDNAGNVGIGTTSPSTKLEIDTGSNTSGLRLLGAAETAEIADIFVGSGGELILSTANTGDSQAYIEADGEDDNYGFILRDSSTGSTVFTNFYMNDAASDYLNISVGGVNATEGLVIEAGGVTTIGAAGSDASWFGVIDTGATDACFNVCDVLFANTTLAAVENVLTISTEDAGTASEFFVRFVSDADGTPDNEFFIHTSGAYQSDGAGTTPADYAEWTRVVGTTTDYVAGDIVAFSSTDRKAKKAIQGEGILGAVTLKPGLVGVSYDLTQDITDFAYGMSSQAQMEAVYGAKIIAQIGYTPLHVSTENGAIANGDPITISSISGIGMKAHAGDQIVGYAFEAFDPAAGKLGTHDVVLPMIDDSISFMPTVSSTTTPSGMAVTIGYVFAKVQVGIAPFTTGIALEELTTFASSSASSTPATGSFMSGFLSNLFSHTVAWLADAGNGIADLFATTIHAETLYAKSVHTDELCVGAVCVTEAQFLNMMQQNQQQPPPAAPPSPPTSEPDTSSSPPPTESVEPPAPDESDTPPVTPPESETPPAETPPPAPEAPPVESTPPAEN